MLRTTLALLALTLAVPAMAGERDGPRSGADRGDRTSSPHPNFRDTPLHTELRRPRMPRGRVGLPQKCRTIGVKLPYIKADWAQAESNEGASVSTSCCSGGGEKAREV